MAIRITDDCINCGACEVECPNNAIYEGGMSWAPKDGTGVEGKFQMLDGSSVDVEAEMEPVSEEYYYIVTEKCTECIGFHDEPQCAAYCPVDCCIPDDDHVETSEELLAKKALLHPDDV